MLAAPLSDLLVNGGAKHVRGFPSHGPVAEGHYYVFAHLDEALSLMMDVLRLERDHDEKGVQEVEDAAGRDENVAGAAVGEDGFAGIVDPEAETKASVEL